MRLRFFAAPLVTVMLATCSLAPARDTVVDAQSIAVFIDFENLPSQKIIAAMEREVGSIMLPAGLTFSWRTLDPAGNNSSFADLVVIKFNGSCSGSFAPFSELGPAERDNTLASTTVTDGRVLHFTEVHCDELRRYLAQDTGSLREKERERLYGQALGRIISHEMYHIFAGTEKHSSGGVARACHSRRELVQPVFNFDEKETKMLREYAGRTLAVNPVLVQ